MKLHVYVAGPYTQGDVALNVRMAISVAEDLLNAGHYPYVPHLTHFWHIHYPHDHADWLALDKAWLAKCDALIRIWGPSKGADEECAMADANEIPVFHSVESFLNWVKKP